MRIQINYQVSIDHLVRACWTAPVNHAIYDQCIRNTRIQYELKKILKGSDASMWNNRYIVNCLLLFCGSTIED
jgi:hypothetical protein